MHIHVRCSVHIIHTVYRAVHMLYIQLHQQYRAVSQCTFYTYSYTNSTELYHSVHIIHTATPTVQSCVYIIHTATPTVQSCVHIIHTATPTVQSCVHIIHTATPTVQSCVHIIHTATPTVQRRQCRLPCEQEQTSTVAHSTRRMPRYIYTCDCCLGCAVLLCLVVCLTLLASFFLPSLLSLKHVHVHCTCILPEECPGISVVEHSV